MSHTQPTAALTLRRHVTNLGVVSLLAVACTHPSSGTGGNANNNGNASGNGNANGNVSGNGSTTGGAGPNGGPEGGAAGSGVTPPDMVLGGGGSGTDARMPVACADDPAQQSALPYAAGYSITAADKSAADAKVAGMNQQGKIDQLHGPQTSGFTDIFRTADDTTNGVKGFEFRDGPRGVDLDPVKGGGNGYSTSFPVASGRGATFDVDLEYKIGQAMGDELIASGGTMLLAPTVNIMRHPAWARAQESYGEDSFMLGRMGSALTAGAQEFAPACVKHYAGNNVDQNRDNVVAKMDEQTLQEVYARHFGMIVRDGGVACVMAAYNAVDSGSGPKKSTQNKHLLTDILRADYGFQGMVLSDWWAMPGSQSADPGSWASNAKEALQAGLDMELPWNLQFKALGGLSGIEADVATAAKRVMETKYRFHVGKIGEPLGLKTPTTHFDTGSYSITGNEAHLALAEEAAAKGMVLLKNDKSILPIKGVTKVAVVGPQVPWALNRKPNGEHGQAGTVNFASDPRLGDLGSSRVNADPAKSVGPCAGIKAAATAGISVTCADGAASADAAKNADFVVIIAGLTAEDEGEDYTITPEPSDRGKSLALDGKAGIATQNAFISSIAAANPGKPIVVVLEGGSTIDVSSFIDKVSGLVMAWYPGQAGGSALGKLLFGAVSFSGKLPFTWAALDQYPPFAGSAGDGNTTVMDYYLGYRYFDTQGKTATFPFGYGLSYSTFEYSNLFVPCSTVGKNGVVNVTVDIKNTGAVAADEIAFAFASFPGSQAAKRAVMGYKELKGFKRVSLMPGEAKRVTIPIRVSDLWYWDTASNSAKVEAGMVSVKVGGGSSADKLMLGGSFTVQ
jgi:beta-glucosidase